MTKENPNLRDEMISLAKKGTAFHTNHDAWKYLHTELKKTKGNSVKDILSTTLKAADSIIENALKELIEKSSLTEIKEALTEYLNDKAFSHIKDAKIIARLKEQIENGSIETIAKTILETRESISSAA